MGIGITVQTKIDKFMGPFAFLSNFEPCTVYYGGLAYPSTEHAYQAAKTLDSAERQTIREATSPGAAKKLGRKVKMRADWDSIKLGVMYDLCLQKFINEPMKAALLATGDAELIEGNTWNDTYWGVCNGVGKNNLGKILMRIRKELSDK